jgi:DNA repair protein RecN (Recombination protein N)
MLKQLHIKNVILIDNAEVNFFDGFHVITGETGAGKSIIFDSLYFVTGGKVSNKIIKHGNDFANVSAIFDSKPLINEILQENNINIDDEVILRRIIDKNGKTKAYINDISVSVSYLKQIGSLLIEINGQNQEKDLFNKASYRILLDEYSENNILLKTTSQSYQEFSNIKQQIADIFTMVENSKREKDYLEYVVRELEQINPKSGEEDELLTQKIHWQSKEKIQNTITSSLDLLINKNDIVSNINNAHKILARGNVPNIDFTKELDLLDQAAILTDEAIANLERLLHKHIDSSYNIEDVEERLFTLREAARKHHCSVEELVIKLDEYQQKLGIIFNADDKLQKLQKDLAIKRKEFISHAENLSRSRKSFAQKLAIDVKSHLADVKLEKVDFKVNLENKEEQYWNKDGLDDITFTVSTNIGSPHGLLSEIASGGEMSRIMLALKLALSKKRSATTILFDEIDTGISGAAADAVGRKLLELGNNTQVICITHQPQVAARCNHHIQVTKNSAQNNTNVTINLLSNDNRITEVAKLIAGEVITDAAIEAAKNLIYSDKVANE